MSWSLPTHSGGKRVTDISPFYLDTLLKNFGAGLHEVDFITQPDPSRIKINDWVADKTHDRIKDLIPGGAINSATRLVLTNAIYFKSQWQEQFTPTLLKMPTSIWIHQQSRLRRSQQQHRFNYFENDDLQAVELPYIGNQLSMVILLPKKADGLSSLEKAGDSKEPYELDGSTSRKHCSIISAEVQNDFGIRARGPTFGDGHDRCV